MARESSKNKKSDNARAQEDGLKINKFMRRTQIRSDRRQVSIKLRQLVR